MTLSVLSGSTLNFVISRLVSRADTGSPASRSSTTAVATPPRVMAFAPHAEAAEVVTGPTQAWWIDDQHIIIFYAEQCAVNRKSVSIRGGQLGGVWFWLNRYSPTVAIYKEEQGHWYASNTPGAWR